MNFFDTLIHPDREENLQRSEVARAANLLQVGEFQLLQLAYEAWFGHEMSARECDRLFGEYMMAAGFGRLAIEHMSATGCSAIT